jgi:hypothetical protein
VRVVDRLVVSLVSLQVIATGFLWTLDPTGRGAQATFATFLGVDLLAFAVISYLYRTQKNAEPASRPWLVVGLFAIASLLISSLFTA